MHARVKYMYTHELGIPKWLNLPQHNTTESNISRNNIIVTHPSRLRFISFHCMEGHQMDFCRGFCSFIVPIIIKY